MSFSWEVYKELNPDLVEAGLKTQLDFVNHFFKAGRREHRKYSVYHAYPDFNPIRYGQKYEDLRCLNIIQLEVHWIKHGRKEGRSYKPTQIQDIKKTIKPVRNTVAKKPIKPLVQNNKFSLINGIDTIYWINLDRSKDRRDILEKFLSNVQVKNKRITGSDAKLDVNIRNNFVFRQASEQPQPAGAYGCLLSHLRTIKEFWDSKEKTALILEDDISLDFMKYWNKDLKTIINQAPPNWDIIMMHYTDTDINNHRYLYNRWNPQIYSTMAYIINRRGAEKIMRLYINNKWYINEPNHASDMVVYKNCNTYVYRYCYFTINTNMNSLIHDSHLQLHNHSKKFAENIWLF
jgi:GR25 family glycosyltransferase involved in LPS biosynthesis